MPGYLFCTAEMTAWVGPTKIADEMCAPKRGKACTPEALERLRIGRAKGKAKNKRMRDALDKAKEKA